MKKPSQLEINSGERLSRKHVRDAIEGITSVTTSIHRLKLSANGVTLDQMFSVLKPGKLHRATSNNSHYEPSYKYVSYHVYKGCRISLYCGPEYGYLPDFRLSITNHDQKILYFLARAIPSLKVSTAEYTIDLGCKNPDCVSRLYYVLRRYMYFKNRSRTSMVGGEFTGIDVDRDTNSAFYVWQRALGMKDIVIYERGDDCDKDGKGWPYEKINRARIEFIARSIILKSLEISQLSEFVKNNMFTEFIDKKINFCVFKKSEKLPQSFQDYNARDKSGNIECFQEEYHLAYKHLKNVCQYVEEATELAPLKTLIVSTANNFQSDWVSRHEKNVTAKTKS